MNITWANDFFGIGSAFGYTTFAKKIKIALRDEGVGTDPNAAIALHMIPPYYFNLMRFKKNVLFTMFEFDRVPAEWHHVIDKAEYIIVPCRHNKSIFSAATDKPVYVCPGGVDAELYPYVERRVDEIFTFLFVGDDNPRKGTWHIAKAWELWNSRYPECGRKSQLIMKMTNPDKKPELNQITSNAFTDYRILPLNEHDGDRMGLPTLPSLYEYAHCFLWPTMGEGWGLPLCEAMSSGLPCIYTPYGGTEDIANSEIAYPVQHSFKKINLKYPGSGIDLEPVFAPDPDIDCIVETMHEVYMKYDVAIEKGRKAAARVQTRFPWSESAKRLKYILDVA